MSSHSSHVWHTSSHACILYKWLCFCILYLQYCIGYSNTIFLFQAQDVRKKHKSNSDIAGAAEKPLELKAQRKDKRQEEEVTEEPKRFIMQEMAREFSLFEEALLVSEV